MEEGSIKERCFICGKKHSVGPHQYEGHWIEYYKIQVCRDCYLGNHDGWNPEAEKKSFHIYKKLELRNLKEIQRVFSPSKFINQQWPGQKGRAIAG